MLQVGWPCRAQSAPFRAERCGAGPAHNGQPCLPCLRSAGSLLQPSYFLRPAR
jgi:hypothetical protein